MPHNTMCMPHFSIRRVGLTKCNSLKKAPLKGTSALIPDSDPVRPQKKSGGWFEAWSMVQS